MRVSGWLRRHGTLLGFLAVLAGFSVAIPGTFLTAGNWLNISQQVSMLAVAAFAMTIVMAMGDFDLSVGAMASLAGVVAAVAFAAGWPVWAGVAAGLAAGLAGGLLNGLFVGVLRMLPFIATLGTMTVFSGAAFLVSGGRTLYGRDIPAAFSGFARGGVPLGPVTLPNLTLAALAAYGLVWLLLDRGVMGQRLYAIGGNAEAARLAGLPVTRLRVIAFALTGLGAAAAGLMYAARVASANPTQGAGLMLNAIAAVFLGQTMGARGVPQVSGTLLGVLMLGVLDNGLTQMSVDSYVRQVLVGGIILGAVAAGGSGRRR